MFYLVVFLFGTLVGSFLSVVVQRSHTGERGIFLGRSHCPHCHTLLGVWELIPLVSYFLQRGHCRNCKHVISFYYPLLELIMGLLFVVLFIRFPFIDHYTLLFPELWGFLLYAGFFATLSAIAFSDVLFMEFSFSLIVVAAVLGLGIAVFEQHLWIASTVWSLVFVAGVFGSQWLLSRGAWLGLGDLYLAFIFAVTLTFPLLFSATFFSYVSGAIFAMFLLISKRSSQKSRIPFAPFLIGGIFVVMMFPNYVVFW